jgi:thiamine pyrophosphate-dependent acetolactate synthase large subunit-like protein
MPVPNDCRRPVEPQRPYRGAAALVRMLERHDVEVRFGLCGDTSLPFYDALAEAVAYGGPTLVDVITQPLHEANAPMSEWVA